MKSNKSDALQKAARNSAYAATLDDVLAFSAPILESIQEGVIVVDANGTVRFVNNAAAAIAGCAREEAVGKPLEHCCGNDTAARLRARRFDVSRRIALAIGKNRSHPLVKTMASPIRRDNETLGAVIVLRNDAMVDRADPKAFKQSRNVVHAIDKLKDRVCIVNDVKRGGHVFISDSIKSITGYTANTVLNGSWAFMMTLMHPDDLRSTAETMQATFAKYMLGTGFESEPYVSRYRCRHKDGRWLRIEENGCLLERDTDGFPRYLLSFLDVVDGGTGRKKPSALKLTQREVDVAHAVVQGDSSKIIAARLGLSVHRVNEIRQRLLQKTGAANTASLVKFLSEHDIR